jgi:hypothetical protein
MRPAVPGYRTKLEQVSMTGVADVHIRSLLDRQQDADPQGAAEATSISTAAR